MKKLLALLFALTLVLSLAGAPARAQEAPAPLTRAEIEDFCQSLLSQALALTPVSAQAAEEGGYRFDYEEFALYSPDRALTAKSEITGAELIYSGHSAQDMRGIGPTNSLSAVLAAYPLDNASLLGTYDEAVLSMRTALPESAFYGRVVRDGSRVLVAEYVAYAQQGDQMIKSCVVYTLENNDVYAVALYPVLEVVSLADTKRELAALSELQEQDDYVGLSDGGEAFSREDMTMCAVDFITGTPEAALAALGTPESDTYARDGAGYLRVMQWEGAQAVFRCDQNKSALSLTQMKIDGTRFEGPRGLRVGDTIDAALSRFPQDLETGKLYGDGLTPPYGAFESYDGGAYARYAADTEDGTVLLLLTFVEGRLAAITCAYL